MYEKTAAFRSCAGTRTLLRPKGSDFYTSVRATVSKEVHSDATIQQNCDFPEIISSPQIYADATQHMGMNSVKTVSLLIKAVVSRHPLRIDPHECSPLFRMPRSCGGFQNAKPLRGGSTGMRNSPLFVKICIIISHRRGLARRTHSRSLKAYASLRCM